MPAPGTFVDTHTVTHSHADHERAAPLRRYECVIRERISQSPVILYWWVRRRARNRERQWARINGQLDVQSTLWFVRIPEGCVTKSYIINLVAIHTRIICPDFQCFSKIKIARTHGQGRTHSVEYTRSHLACSRIEWSSHPIWNRIRIESNLLACATPRPLFRSTLFSLCVFPRFGLVSQRSTLCNVEMDGWNIFEASMGIPRGAHDMLHWIVHMELCKRVNRTRDEFIMAHWNDENWISLELKMKIFVVFVPNGIVSGSISQL